MDAAQARVAEIVAKREGKPSAESSQVMPDSAPTNPTPEKRTTKQRFLEAFSTDGTVTGSAKAAGIARCTVYDWRESDPVFAQAFEDAKEAGVESLEREARRRAMGRSDVLLIFLLKAARPDVYAERVKAEHTGANGGPIAHADTTADQLATYALEALATIEAAERICAQSSDGVREVPPDGTR